ncbi:alcohol dehydrogenase (NADP(+)) [Malassezia brasiliensis]|uniref:Alcohol dehydrogenase (NADP(+)) n=1 Tax=Malassezia brasiliensis TaxID=1821822 RepID=A0AAF0IQ97_9BASI|nr:alcohol dehydrogenase (NADP(+)) [Malassezia brasiliensis]
MSTQVDLGTVFKGSSSGKIVQAKGATVELKPDQVVIDIAYSGLCGSDLHFRKNGDIVLGHEGVGVISQVGKDVDFLKVGDRVGWGCNHDACNYCKQCWNGVDTLCPHRAFYSRADFEFGSFGDRAVLSGYFVHKIPDGLPLKYAGPLQCGGATVYGAIVKAGVRPIDRVGVVGLGGLGHLAVQYLNKMGCEVVVFSHSASKKDEAKKLGAHEFVAVKENPELKDVKPINHLLVSTSQQPDWKLFFKVMAPRGSIVPLSLSYEEMKHPYGEILMQELTITGSLVARREVHKEMLEFSARHDVHPWIEELPMTEEGVNTAFDRLEKGDVRYRFVLKSQRTDAE